LDCNYPAIAARTAVDVLAAETGDLAKKPAPEDMYTNAIIESLDEPLIDEVLQ
jgi:hypothetical protein